jgi:hypothetical protein
MSANSERVIRCRKRLKVRAVAYLGGSCIKCGYAKCVDAMDFHHRDPTIKDFQIGAGGVYHRFELVKIELDKCDLLCANCHRELHASVRDLEPPKRGNPHVTWPSFDELNLRVQQETLASIASSFGVNRVTVRYWCQKLGVQMPPHGSRLSGGKMVTRKNPTLWPSPDLLRVMVWRKPLLQIAKDLGVSDVAVKKRCNRLGILTPPRGYWAQQEALTLATTRFPPVSELRIRISTTSYKRLAGELGCDPRTLRNYLLRQATA